MPSQVQQLQSLLKCLANTESIEEITLGNCVKSVSVEERCKSLQNVRGEWWSVKGQTALQGAVVRRYKQSVRALLDGLTLEQKYEILKVQDIVGDTALHYAAYYGHTDTARVLLSNLTQEYQLTLLEIQDSWGGTAFHCAAYKGHTDTARLLLRNLAQEHQLTLLDMQSKYGRTARDEAIWRNHPETGACLQKIRAEAEEAINRVSRDRNNQLQSGVTKEELAGVLRAVNEVEQTLGARVKELEVVCEQRDGRVEELEAAVMEAEQRLGAEVENLKVVNEQRSVHIGEQDGKIREQDGKIRDQDGKIREQDVKVQQLEAELSHVKQDLKHTKQDLKQTKQEVGFLSDCDNLFADDDDDDDDKVDDVEMGKPLTLNPPDQPARASPREIETCLSMRQEKMSISIVSRYDPTTTTAAATAPTDIDQRESENGWAMNQIGGVTCGHTLQNAPFRPDHTSRPLRHCQTLVIV